MLKDLEIILKVYLESSSELAYTKWLLLFIGRDVPPNVIINQCNYLNVQKGQNGKSPYSKSGLKHPKYVLIRWLINMDLTLMYRTWQSGSFNSCNKTERYNFRSHFESRKSTILHLEGYPCIMFYSPRINDRETAMNL